MVDYPSENQQLHQEIEKLCQQNQAQAEQIQKLKQQEVLLQLVLDNIPQLIFWKDVNSVFQGCNRRWAEAAGLYDASGEWTYRVGLPAKSGGGGGMTAVAPGKMGIGTFSPLLDAKGNSIRGMKVCEDISWDCGLHLFNVARPEYSIQALTDCHYRLQYW